MRVTVTGAGGLTGGAVTQELVRRGHDVIGLTRSVLGAERARGHGAEVVVGDCADPATVDPLLARSDALVHVAGILLGERLASAHLEPLDRTLVVSTASVYSSLRADAATYRRNEDAIRKAQPRVLFIRPTMIYGSSRDRNIHHVISFADRFGFLPIPAGAAGRVQPIHYADLAAVIASLLAKDVEGVVDAGGPAPLTLGHAARAILAAVGRRPTMVPVPLPLALLVGASIDLISGGRWRERIDRVREERTVDNTRLLALTEVEMRSFENGVRAEVAEMRAARR